MTRPDARVYDAVIVGGGLAGLTLYGTLAASREWRGRSVVIVEPEPERVDGRSWAYWSCRPMPLDAVTTRAWRRVAVHAGGRYGVADIAPYTYRYLPGAALRRAVAGMAGVAGVAGMAGGRPGFRTVRDTVTAVEPGSFGAPASPARVHLATGKPVSATWVFDGRPPPAAPRTGPAMSFTGMEIVTGTPAFDTSTVTFVDFRHPAPPPGSGLRFCYLLPLGPDRALVDLVRFHGRAGGPEEEVAGGGRSDAGDELEAYLSSVLRLSAWTVVRREGGTLPLVVRQTRAPGGRVLRIGRAGGLLRASSGFAAYAIQRDAIAVAASLARHGHPFDLPRTPARHSWMDSVMMRVAVSDPPTVERAFAGLFSGPARDVLRFLDGESTVAQDFRMVTRMPLVPFLGSAVAGIART